MHILKFEWRTYIKYTYKLEPWPCSSLNDNIINIITIKTMYSFVKPKSVI